MPIFRKPGVYIKENSSLPPSVAQVETAIPAFIGYAEKGPSGPTRIRSLVDFTAKFGGPCNQLAIFHVSSTGSVSSTSLKSTPDYRLYYMLEMFFANGGRDCFIVRVGGYGNGIANTEMQAGLELLKKLDDPTLILFPDAASPLNGDEPYDLFNSALDQCASSSNRFLICDVAESDAVNDPVNEAAVSFRNGVGMNNLKYGATYYPDLRTTLRYRYNESEISINFSGNSHWVLRDDTNKSRSLYHTQNGKFTNACAQIKKIIDSVLLILPPSGAVAGIYARVDSDQGVWKAPANVSLNRVTAPNIAIDDRNQAGLNVTPSGKSINAIREFPGRGVMVWGARTLDGNDNEWRYISTRRFLSMVEASVKKACEPLVFEPNDANTWANTRVMIENYLNTLWRSGALAGASQREAYYVRAGLGQTMSQQDVLNGLFVVEFGMAVTRPAEFILLRVALKMLKS